MITCKRILFLLSEYFDQELDSPLLDEIQQHLASCPHCLFLSKTLKSAIDVSHSFGESEIPREVHYKLWRTVEFTIHHQQPVIDTTLKPPKLKRKLLKRQPKKKRRIKSQNSDK